MFAVVQVEGVDRVDPDCLIQRLHRFCVFLGGTNRVAGRKQMAGIETNTEARRLGQSIEKACEMFESMPQLTALSSRVFQQASYGFRFQLPIDLAQCRDDSFQAGLIRNWT